MPAPTAHLQHSVRGRMRLRVPSKKRDSAYFDQLEERLARLEGVRDVETNHLTGSVLIRHDTDLGTIERYAQQHGLFSVAQLAGEAIALAHRVHDHMEDLDDQVLDFTRGTLDLRSIMLVALTAGAVIQTFRKELMPPAFNLAWAALALVWPHHPEHKQT